GMDEEKPPEKEEPASGGIRWKKMPDLVQKKKSERNAADAEIEEALARSSVSQKKTLARKKYFKLGGGGVAVVLLIFFIKFLFTPYNGSMAYGVCKVFLELTVQYPDHLYVSTVEEFDSSVRIWYTQLDSFGAYRMEPIQCYFRAD